MAVATQKIVIIADDKTGAAIQSAIRNSKKLDNQMKKTSDVMRGMTRQGRAQFGQLGHQIQDVAVQYQMGMNPLMILGQQGSQIASIFGAGGAVIGSFLAVAAVIVSQVAPAFFEAADAAEELEKANKKLDRVVVGMKGGVVELTSEIRELAKANLELAQLELSLGIVEAEAAFKAATRGITESLDDLMSKFMQSKSLEQLKKDFELVDTERSRNAVNAAGRIKGALNTLAENLGITRDQAKELTTAMIAFGEDSSTEGIQKLRQFLVGFADNVDLADEDLRDLITSLIDNSGAALDAAQMQEKLNEILGQGSEGFKDHKEATKKAKEELEALSKEMREHLSLRDKYMVQDQKLLQLQRDLAEAELFFMDPALANAIRERIALHKEEIETKRQADLMSTAKKIISEQKERNDLLMEGMTATQKMAAEHRRLIEVIGLGRDLGQFDSAELAAYKKAMEEYHEEVYGDRNKQRAKEAREAARKLADERKKLAKLDQEAMKIMQDMASPQEKFIAYQEKINQLVTSHGLSQEAANKALAEAAKEYKIVNTALQEVGERGMQSFEDGLVDIISGAKSAKDAFADMARSIIRDLIRMQVQQQITNNLNNMLTSFLAPATPTSQFQGARPTLSTPRALGGPVSAGRPYMVGERGPELMIPGRAGTVVPNNKLGGGDVINISLNVSTGVAQTVQSEITAMIPKIQEMTKAAVIDAKMRGGSFSSAFGA